MNRNYFKTLFHCVLASISMLGASTVLKLHPALAMIGGISPLVYYHLVYLRPQAKSGLSQTAIDSVYYFGFLVTVAALGISAIVIAGSGGVNGLDTVIYQFGVGLFATGYAVIARMHLNSISIMVDEASPEALLDRYVKRSVELITNVEIASDQLIALSSNLMEKSVQVAETSRSMMEKTMGETTKAFEGEMRRSLETARDSLTTIRGLVSDTSFASEREELARSMSASIEATIALNKAIGELAQRTSASAHVTEASILTSTSLDKTLQTFAAHIDELGGENGIFPKSAASFLTASETIASCNISMAEAAVGLSEIANVVADTGPTFKTMRTLTKKASEQLDGLADASEKLNKAAENLTDAAVASDSLAVGMSKVTSAMAPLALGADALRIQLANAEAQTERLEKQLSMLPQNVMLLKDMGDHISISLSHVSDVIGATLSQAKEISSHSTATGIAVEAANLLLSNADNLQKSISSLQQIFDGLSDSIISSQRTLSDSSANIKSSIERSTEALQLNVSRSSDAASLLTTSLVQVAQNIIDRTKHPEAV